jgi:hypothetical protein
VISSKKRIMESEWGVLEEAEKYGVGILYTLV